MKKTGSKRGSGYEAGSGSGVLTAPGESYAFEPETREAETRAPRQGRGGPAPAGAYQRGYASDGYDEPGAGGYSGRDEEEYVPRRGKLKLRFRGLPRSMSGRIVLGVVGFVLLATVVVAVAGVRYYLMHDSRFVLATSDDVQITGAEHLTRDQVLNVFGADLERNIFRVPLAQRQSDLERLPWVAHATVMRLLPDVLRVGITERTPVAFVRQGTQIGLVDGSGVLLDMPPDAAGDPHYSFPVLTGISAKETMEDRATQMEVYEQFMRDLDSTGQHLTDSVSEVDISDPEDVKALVTSGSSDVLVHFGQAKFLQRYQEFEQHLAEWKQAYPRLASADMRYEGQIVLEMQGDGDSGTSGATTVATAGVSSAAPVAAKPVVTAKAAAPKVVVPKPVVKAVTPKVVATKAAAPKAPAPRPVVAKAAAPKWKRPVAKRVVAKRVIGKPKPGSGVDAANEKVFARLAAEHRAALAKEHKAETAKAGKSGRTGGSVGVTR